MLRNFVLDICGADRRLVNGQFIEMEIAKIREKVGSLAWIIWWGRLAWLVLLKQSATN